MKTDTTTSESKTPEPKITSEEVLEDVFGLNILGLKSLLACFRRPQDYYAAARDPQWTQAFTPAFRLWFTGVALTLFFQFLWAGQNSALIENYTSQLESMGTLPDDVSPKAAALEFARWSVGYLPFSLVFCLFVFAWAYRGWGKKMSFALRQRYVFISIIPSTYLLIPLMIVVSLATTINTIIAMLGTYVVGACLDSLTSYRGAFSNNSKWGRLWRSILFALCALLTSLIAGLLANILASLSIYLKYG